MTYDIVIRGGQVVDGTGMPPVFADVAIIQKALGFDHTLVNGQIFMEKGEHAGALAGRLQRAE